MFSRCYCVKLNPLRYQHVLLFFPLLYFISRISMIRQASTEQLDSLPILQQSVIPEHNKFSSHTRSTKTIIIVLSLKGWKIFFHLFTFLYPLYSSFILFGFFGEVGRRIIFRAFPPSFRGYGRETLYLVSFSIFPVNSRKANQTSADPIIHYETLYLKKKSFVPITH